MYSESRFKILNGHKNKIACIGKLSNDEIISGSLDKTIKLCNVNSSICLGTFEGHLEYEMHVEFLSNERIIRSSSDSIIKIWDVQNGDCLLTLGDFTAKLTFIRVLFEEK